ncbi:T9SS type A sorting domain-containing protein [Aquimarina sp. MMG016]|uniref:T9SS type A sorting domain-containing protein n=1 Tax=Aquimarina sp. MMG016 TaxID=2822690 RepID=UPI001B39EF60|nr:T9SS type A sorting domain-containing protein [Aquimarina sp. MMG016]MBQ4819728.1 T9SS type A sorting domain-containing protein [Aquimarina sp. MMG016]
MKKIYLTLIFIGIVCFSFSSGVQAQSDTPKRNARKVISNIENLQVYPNPTNGDKLYVTTESGHSMIVTIYNALGEKVLYKVLIGKELNISSLKAGVYIMKVKQRDFQSTLKLVVRS